MSAPPQAPPAHWGRRAVVVTLLAALLYAAFALATDVRALREAMESFAWWTLGAAVGLVLVGYALRAARWNLYLRVLGHPVPFALGTKVFLSGFAMGVTPGKVGEVVKAYYLREARGTPYAVSIPAVFAERVNDLLAVALLLGLGLLVVPSFGLPLGILVVGAVAVGVLVLRSERLARLALGALGRVPRATPLAQTLGEMHANLRPLLTGRLLALATGLGLGGWALEAFAMVLLAQGLGVDLSWGACAFVFAAGSMAGVLSFLPGGLGVTEGGMVVLLLALGVAVAPATALTLLIRLATLWLGVVVGVVAIVLLRRDRPPAPPSTG